MATSVRMWCFLLFAAFMPIVPTVTKVVDSVSDSAEFLLQQSPPEIPGILQGGKILNQNRYKIICQTLKGQKRFLTIYDTKNKIPVFSAYKYKGEKSKGRPKPNWKIEEQLEERNNNNMEDDVYVNQASNNDYKNNKDYNRGHLFPVCHAFDRNDKISTFTLTNIVPQAISFNKGSWQKMETCTKCIMENYCINNNGITEGFVVTGAQPSKSNKLNNRVNIPSKLWTAFCCYSHNTKKWIAGAHWGDNIAENESKYLQTKTLAELHQELSTENSGFEVFPGTPCPLHTTVAEFYPEMAGQCQCDPQASTTTASSITMAASPTTTATTATTTTTTTTKKEKNQSENKEDNGQEETQEQPEGNTESPSGVSEGSVGVLGLLAGTLVSACAVRVALGSLLTRKPLTTTIPPTTTAITVPTAITKTTSTTSTTKQKRTGANNKGPSCGSGGSGGVLGSRAGTLRRAGPTINLASSSTLFRPTLKRSDEAPNAQFIQRATVVSPLVLSFLTPPTAFMLSRKSK